MAAASAETEKAGVRQLGPRRPLAAVVMLFFTTAPGELPLTATLVGQVAAKVLLVTARSPVSVAFRPTP